MKTIKEYENLVNWRQYRKNMNSLGIKLRQRIITASDYIQAASKRFDEAHECLVLMYYNGTFGGATLDYLNNRLADMHTKYLRRAILDFTK